MIQKHHWRNRQTRTAKQFTPFLKVNFSRAKKAHFEFRFGSSEGLRFKIADWRLQRAGGSWQRAEIVDWKSEGIGSS